MRPIPKDPALDSSLSLLAEGYMFVLNRCRTYGSDMFEARILLEKTVCMLGVDAARVFYDSDKFVRQGAMPGRVQKTLLGLGGVQGLDDAAHRQRKQMFVELLMEPSSIDALANEAKVQWRAAFDRWQGRERIVFFDEAQEVFCRAVCAWAGVPLAQAEARQCADDLGAMIDSAGRLGPGYWRGRTARIRCERWISKMIERVRHAAAPEDSQTVLYRVAMQRNMEGALLPIRVAAVELLNILRPTVAIARFVTFGLLALHEHPKCREKIVEDDDYLHYFVQEVRRYYPFFPLLAARARKDFEWNGYRFRKSRKVLLDLYGTNHDARTWDAPDAFQPERFAAWDAHAFGFIPQGGGDHRQGHRCPGEWITVELMKQALMLLTNEVDYAVPLQDLHVDLGRMPALPASGFIVNEVRRREEPVTTLLYHAQNRRSNSSAVSGLENR
jgi:fatty-acid peroxygenase